jgi:hypothetical protein
VAQPHTPHDHYVRHSLPGGRYPLPGPNFHRLDHASFAWRTKPISTHKPALLPSLRRSEARRLVERFEWHYTPKHGSWLNLAESELSVVSTQCLDERIPDKQTLIDQIAAWQANRHKAHVKANWRLTTKEARAKLHQLYPAV